MAAEILHRCRPVNKINVSGEARIAVKSYCMSADDHKINLQRVQ